VGFCVSSCVKGLEWGSLSNTVRSRKRGGNNLQRGIKRKTSKGKKKFKFRVVLGDKKVGGALTKQRGEDKAWESDAVGKFGRHRVRRRRELKVSS